MTILFHKIFKHCPWLFISQGGLNSKGIISEKRKRITTSRKILLPTLLLSSALSIPKPDLCIFRTACFYTPLPWKHMPVTLPPFCNELWQQGSHDENNQKWPAQRKTGFQMYWSKWKRVWNKPTAWKTNLMLFISLVHKSFSFVLVLGAFMDEIMNMVAFYSYEQQVPW